MVRSMKYEQIIENLNKIDSDDIANLLFIRGIAGTPDNAESCPLAQYFKELGANEVRVDHDEIVIDGGHYICGDNITDFIYLFDNGEFPELEE